MVVPCLDDFGFMCLRAACKQDDQAEFKGIICYSYFKSHRT